MGDIKQRGVRDEEMGKSFRFNRQYRCNADHRNRMLEKEYRNQESGG